MDSLNTETNTWLPSSTCNTKNDSVSVTVIVKITLYDAICLSLGNESSKVKSIRVDFARNCVFFYVFITHGGCKYRGECTNVKFVVLMEKINTLKGR